MKHFSNDLIQWYKKHARDLPWRKTFDPYKIWISEIMLQQTTVNAVIPYYERWISEFPNIKSVAMAPLEKILKVWQGLGYYQRAKNIYKSAQIIVRDHGGKIPQTRGELRNLPGFGPYTTGAVLSIAFDRREPIIDANVRRVVMRQLAIEGHADTSQDSRILGFLDKVMPPKGNNIFNQALMELGALVCRSREPICLFCPVKSNCLAYQKGVQEIIPTPKKKIIKDVDVAIALIERDGKYFIQKRPAKGLLADLWEFPGGKVEKGESSEEALYREVKEELGVQVRAAKFVMNLVHFYTEFRVKLHVWLCEPVSWPKEDKTHNWVTLKDISNYPMPSGSAKIVDWLIEDSKEDVMLGQIAQQRERDSKPSDYFDLEGLLKKQNVGHRLS